MTNNNAGSVFIGPHSTMVDTTTFTTSAITSPGTVTIAGYDHWKQLPKNINLDMDSDIIFGDTSLRATLDKINSRLAVLQPNPELESQWQQLKQLGDQYRELEIKLLEKQKMWETIQK
jgi:hypothetical protein